MIKLLNDIRNAENSISNNSKIINTIVVLFLGIALGTFSKYLDFRQAELPCVLMAIDEAFDIHNFLGRFAIWVLIALCISIYSNSAIRASVNVFAFFVGMVASYYLYSNYIAGFFPRSYAMIWFGFTAVSPLLAFVCWYARGKSKLEFAYPKWNGIIILSKNARTILIVPISAELLNEFLFKTINPIIKTITSKTDRALKYPNPYTKHILNNTAKIRADSINSSCGK